MSRRLAQSHTTWQFEWWKWKERPEQPIYKLVDCPRNLEEKDDELDILLMLVLVDEQRIPSLQRPYLCCRPTLLVRQLCQYVALQIALQASETEIYLVKEFYSMVNMSTFMITKPGLAESVRDMVQVLKEETSAGVGMQNSSHGHLLLAYQKK